MPSYVPPKKNTAFVFAVGLIDQSNTKLLKANPTLAAGDVQVSIDGGAFANLATLPTVTPAGGKRVKVQLSAAEMNGDNITVLFSDQAGSEWCDLEVNIQTSAQQIDDLAASGNVPTAAQIADSVLGRNIAGGSNGGRTVTSALRILRNKKAISGGLMSVYQEDDATLDHQENITTAAGNPVVSSVPTTIP